MKDWWEALILGIVQGLTEFLPVSSSGHLELLKYYLEADALTEETSLTFTVTLHAATALSTLVVFRRDIAHLFRESLHSPYNRSQHYILLIGLSMLPAVFVGLYFEEFIEALFSEDVLLVAVMLCVTAGFLFLADLPQKQNKKLGGWSALLIGCVQAVAILPGISRSGSTISASVLLGLKRKEAARFSFLMVLPLIFGKMIRDILAYDEAFQSLDPLYLLVGFLAAFGTGILACNWMIALVRRSKLSWFAMYCLSLAVFVFIDQSL